MGGESVVWAWRRGISQSVRDHVAFDSCGPALQLRTDRIWTFLRHIRFDGLAPVPNATSGAEGRKRCDSRWPCLLYVHVAYWNAVLQRLACGFRSDQHSSHLSAW